MIRIERMLCPTDLSADSGRTLRYAVAMARAFEAKLFVCHRPQNLSVRGIHADLIQKIKILVDEANSVGHSQGPEPSPLDWESVLLEDEDVGEGIISEAEKREAHLIFMRSRRRPLAAALMGSTAETVSRLAPCPVLVMHADEREWLDSSTGSINLNRILVAYDFSPYSELALQYAIGMAQQYQGELHLLHVMPEPIAGAPEVAWVGQDTNEPYHQAARRLQQAVPAQVHLWCKVRHAVQWGRPYSEVLTYSENHEVDLICMGAHGHGYGSYALFGSNVDRVLRQARCPVVVLRPLRPTGVR